MLEPEICGVILFSFPTGPLFMTRPARHTKKRHGNSSIVHKQLLLGRHENALLVSCAVKCARFLHGKVPGHRLAREFHQVGNMRAKELLRHPNE